MNQEIVIFGYGPVGRATAQALSERKRPMRIAQRKQPQDLPAGASFIGCDVLDRDSVRAAAQGASHVVLAVGFPYESALWREAWPRTMNNFVEVCAEIGARLARCSGGKTWTTTQERCGEYRYTCQRS